MACSDHYCICRIEKLKGMGTNGACSCLRDLPPLVRIEIQRKIQFLENRIKELEKP